MAEYVCFCKSPHFVIRRALWTSAPSKELTRRGRVALVRALPCHLLGHMHLTMKRRAWSASCPSHIGRTLNDKSQTLELEALATSTWFYPL